MRGGAIGFGMVLLIASVGATACGFSASQSNVDGGSEVEDPPTIGFTEASSLQDESSGTIMIPVSLSAAAAVPITIGYTLTGGTAINGVDYEGADGTLTFEPGELQQPIVLTILADPDESDDENILLELGPPTGGAVLGRKHHAVTISSDILPRVYFTQTASMELESVAMLTLNVALDISPKVAASVPFAVTGTAASGVDHLLAGGSLAFAPGEQSRTITLPVLQDALDEDDETVVVTLTTGTNVVIGNEPVRTHTILDDDPLPTASFLVASSSVVEGTTTVSVTVQLDVVSGRDVTIPLVAGMGSATAGTDFDYPITLAVTIPAGTLSTSFALAVLDDQLDEDDETVVIELGASTTATVAGTTTYTLTITDNDNPPQVRFDPGQSDGDTSESNTGPFDYRVELTRASGKLVTVEVSFATSTATEGQDYTIRAGDLPVTFLPGQTTRTLRLTVINDNIKESANGGNEHVHMTLTSPTNASLGSPTLRSHRIRDND